jgi:choline dehydrogenase-like flavoprotein
MRVLEALCARITGVEDDAPTLAAAIEARLLPEHDLRRRFGTLLHLFDHPVTSVVFGRRARRFTALTPAEQDARLREWEASRLGPRRAAFEAIRKTIISTYYAQPAVAARIGHRGPLHKRGPAFAWEGPAPGEPTGDEPIARSSRPTPARKPMPPGIVQGQELPATTELRADVCVIGSGAGGSVVAARLADAGRSVVVLEEGGYWSPNEFTENEAQMIGRLYADAGLRATADVGLALLQGRCVGGGTTVNWMIMLRPPPWVMEEWEQEHGAELLSAATLVPALERIEEEVHARLVPDDAHSPANRVILDGAAKLGWRASGGRINADGCIRAGTCGIGCRYRAKQGALETYLPRALAAGARVYSDVQVTRLRRSASDTTRVEATVLDRRWRTPRGRLTVDAPTVVLAAGAVGTPVILQRSGLGGGAIGRFLRLHPTTGVLGLYPRPVYAAAGIPQTAVCTEFLGRSDGFGFWIECPPLLPGLSAAGLPGFGAAHRQCLQDFPYLAPLIVLVRDGAERTSQGSVSATRAGPRIRYRLGAAERRTLAEGIHAAVRMHRAAGAQKVTTLHAGGRTLPAGHDIDWILRATATSDRVGLFSAHVNGTCRMGKDPRTSGCNPDGQHHGAPGVYIADGSILPSAPSANPQAIIMAIGSLVAERIRISRG